MYPRRRRECIYEAPNREEDACAHGCIEARFGADTGDVALVETFLVDVCQGTEDDADAVWREWERRF